MRGDLGSDLVGGTFSSRIDVSCRRAIQGARADALAPVWRDGANDTGRLAAVAVEHVRV